MTFPDSWATIPVSGTFLNRDGSPAEGYVSFTHPRVTLTDGGVVSAGTITFRLDDAGAISGSIPQPPENGFWTYLVHEAVPNGRAPYYLTLNSGSTAINLSEYPPANLAYDNVAASQSAMAALPAPTGPSTTYIRARAAANDGGHGMFEWADGDRSADVTADPSGAIFVPPASDTTGKSGAWRRQVEGVLYPEWAGATVDSDDIAPALQDLQSVALHIGVRYVEFRGPIYQMASTFLHDDYMTYAGNCDDGVQINLKIGVDIDGMWKTRNFDDFLADPDRTDVNMAQGIGLRNITFWGQQESQPTTQSCSGLCMAESGGVLSNITSVGFTNHGIHTVGNKNSGENWDNSQPRHPIESHYDRITCAHNLGRGFNYDGAADAVFGQVICSDNGEAGIYNGALATIYKYVHCYSNNKVASTDKYQFIGGAMNVVQMQLRDGMYGGLHQTTSANIGWLRLKDNCRASDATDVWQLLQDDSGGLTCWNLNIDCDNAAAKHAISLSGYQNDIKLNVTGEQHAVDGIVVNSNNNRIAGYITGIDGPPYKQETGTSNIVSLISNNCTDAPVVQSDNGQGHIKVIDSDQTKCFDSSGCLMHLNIHDFGIAAAATATTFAKVITPAPVNSTNGGGAWTLKIKALVGNDDNPASNYASAKYVEAVLAHVNVGSGGATNGDVSNIVSTASAASGSAHRDVGDVTFSVNQADDQTTEIQVSVAVSGSDTAYIHMSAVLELIWENYTVSPLLQSVA